MTGAGVIITLFQVFISTWTQAGEGITEAMTGTDTRGTTIGSLTGHSNKTGGAGIIMDIGGKEAGASGAIGQDLKGRDRN